MGKSFRKTDIIGNGGTSDKCSKRIANRVLRHRTKILIGKDPETEILPVVREVSDVWDFNKDGKGWFGNIPHGNQSRYPHRKFFDDPFWIKYYREMKGK